MSNAPKLSTVDNQFTERAARRSAYIPVQIRRFRHLPVFRVDAQLIDVSEGGIKLQCGRDLAARVGESFWLVIPSMKEGGPAVVVRAECRWYGNRDRTLGASFVDLGVEGTAAIQNLIDALRSMGRMGV